MEIKLPAIQAEQVEDELAPLAAEYVPAQASDEEYAQAFRYNSSRANCTREKGPNNEIKVWAKKGRDVKADSRWHLQGMELIPKSPLDSSPLKRGMGRGRRYFEESGPKQEMFSK